MQEGLAHLVKELDIVIGAVVGIGPLPGTEALVGVTERHLSVDPLAQVDAALVVLGGSQDQFGEVDIPRVEVDLSSAVKCMVLLQGVGAQLDLCQTGGAYT